MFGGCSYDSIGNITKEEFDQGIKCILYQEDIIDAFMNANGMYINSIDGEVEFDILPPAIVYKDLEK